MQAIRHAAAIPGRRLAENMLAVVFMLSFAAVILDRLSRLVDTLEYTELSIAVRNLRYATMAVTGDHLAADAMSSLPRLVGANPVAWMENPPARYRGEISRAGGVEPHGHDWYFDRDTRRLVYVIADSAAIASDAINPQHIEFRVVLRYGDNNANGVFDEGVDEPWKLAFVSLAPYRAVRPLRHW